MLHACLQARSCILLSTIKSSAMQVAHVEEGPAHSAVDLLCLNQKCTSETFWVTTASAQAVNSVAIPRNVAILATYPVLFARFRYRQDFESRYELKEKVGSGSFGTVYKVSSKQNGEE